MRHLSLSQHLSTWIWATALGLAPGAHAAEPPAATPALPEAPARPASACPVPSAAEPAAGAPVLWQADTGG